MRERGKGLVSLGRQSSEPRRWEYLGALQMFTVEAWDAQCFHQGNMVSWCGSRLSAVLVDVAKCQAQRLWSKYT